MFLWHRLVLLWMALAPSKGTEIPHVAYHPKKKNYICKSSFPNKKMVLGIMPINIR